MRAGLQAARTLLWLCGVAALTLSAGCGPGSGQGAAGDAGEAAPNGEEGYRPPPELTAVTPTPGGGLLLAGRAPPGVQVRLATPDGATATATADDRGLWRITPPTTSAPRLFGLSMLDGARVVQAQGYLFLGPDGVAARLRAGGGTELIEPPAQGVTATSLDSDKAMAITVSGHAAPGEGVTLRVDGIARGQTTADAHGRFVVPLTQPLSAGDHDFNLFTASGDTHQQVSIAAPTALTTTHFAATHSSFGWRIDWQTPGGGEQTTVLITSPPAAAASSVH